MKSYIKDQIQAKQVMNMLPEDGVLTFGKFKGVHIFDVEPDYIEWAKENIPFFEGRYIYVSGLHVPAWRCRPSGASLPHSGHNVPERVSEEATGPSVAQEQAWRANDVDSVPEFARAVPALLTTG